MKAVFLTLWLMAVTSFAAQAGHHEADKEQVVIGMGLSMDGESKPLYAGSALLMTSTKSSRLQRQRF